MDSSGSPEIPSESSERKTWKSCFFCSFPIPVSSPEQYEEDESEEDKGRKGSSENLHRPLQHHSDSCTQVSKKKPKKDILFKYFLSGCKDEELKDNLHSPSFQLKLCEVCEGRAVDIQELDRELRAIQMKLTDKIKEVKQIIIANNRRRRTRSYQQLFAHFRTFLQNEALLPAEAECCAKVEVEDIREYREDTDPEWADSIEPDDEEEMDTNRLVKEEREEDEVDDNDSETDNGHINISKSSPNSAETSNISSTKKKNKCNICQEKFNGSSAVLRHKIRVHNHPKLQCELCPPPGKSYMCKMSLNHHHLRCHSNDNKEIKRKKKKKTGVIYSSDDEDGDIQHDQPCELCSETFKNYSSLILHCHREHPSTSLKCSLCPNSKEAALLSPLDELPRHLDESHGISDLRLTCDVPTCGKIFYLRKRLRKHKEVHHKKNHCCKKCKEVFPSNSELKAHNATVHFQTRRLSCNLCSERFSGRNALVCHKISVHNITASEAKMRKMTEVSVREKKAKSVGNVGENEQVPLTKKQYTCELCSKSFASPDTRLSHKVAEHGHPKLKCELCPPSPGSFFNCHSTLSAHRKRHHPAEGEDNFPCSKCPKQFRTKNLKDNHEKIHVTTKDFSCDQCGFATKTKQTLTMHVMRMHATSTSFCCEICGYSTTMSSDLRHHMKNHNPQFECSECGKRFARQSNLTLHLHSHDTEATFQCDVCHQMFKHKSGLIRHRRKQHAIDVMGGRRRPQERCSAPIVKKKL